MIRATALALLLACGRSQGIPDEELGNLVLAPKHTEAAIDVERAAKDPAELGRALMRPYREAIAAIGPHALAVAMTTSVTEANSSTELGEKYALELGDADAFHGTYTNTDDYGRETIWTGKELFLRPRYQRWHARAPEAPDETLLLRDGFAAAIGATWELFGFAAELTDLGPAGVNGRAGRKIAVKLSPNSRTPPPEPLAQRKWRIGRVVETLSGEVILDAEKGVPLSVVLEGQIAFARDGKKLGMKVSLESGIAKLGAVAIAAPPVGEVVATPERLKEVDDRDTLLDGFAPPQKVQKK
jgi:hypothetical protein